MEVKRVSTAFSKWGFQFGTKLQDSFSEDSQAPPLPTTHPKADCQASKTELEKCVVPSPPSHMLHSKNLGHVCHLTNCWVKKLP